MSKVRVPTRVAVILGLMTATLSACANAPTPSPIAVATPNVATTSPSRAPEAAVDLQPPPTATSRPPLQTPTPLEPAPSPVAPPYAFYGDQQQPGTIVFGTFEPDGKLDPFAPRARGPLGITRTSGGIDHMNAFGAFWGEPVGQSSVAISLYGYERGVLELIWSDVKSIDRKATGVADTLVPFPRPGLYRMEVTRGNRVIAWGLADVSPQCTRDCAGG